MSDAGKAAADGGKGVVDTKGAAAAAGKGADAGKGAGEGKQAADAGKAGADKGKVGTILDGSVEHLQQQAAGDEGGDRAAAATWPDDWRDQMSGGDEKVTALLKRYGSPQAVAAALKNIRTRVDSGEFKKPLAKDATEDEIKQYRKDNAIPETAEGYAMPDGIKIGDQDKPIIDNFLTYMHGKNATPAEVQDTIKWYYQAQDEANAQMFEKDKAFRTEQEDSLRAEWGPEFRGNMNGLKGFMKQSFGDELTTALMGARLADGTVAGNNGAFLKAMVGLAKEINPSASVTGPGAGDNVKAVEDRIAEIEKMMGGPDRDKYFKDEKVQAEYRSLLGAKEKLEARKTGRAA